MSYVTDVLAPHEFVAWAWRMVAWACAAYLLVLGTLMFIRPAIVHRFFGGFAASQRINFLEAVVRLIVGLAFIAVSPETRLPIAFFGFGAVLAVTAIPLMFLWRLHKAQGSWVIPFTRRFLPLMGVIAIAAGVLVAWAMV